MLMAEEKSKLVRMTSGEYEMLEEVVLKAGKDYKKVNQNLVLRALIRMASNEDVSKKLNKYIKEIKLES